MGNKKKSPSKKEDKELFEESDDDIKETPNSKNRGLFSSLLNEEDIKDLGFSPLKKVKTTPSSFKSPILDAKMSPRINFFSPSKDITLGKHYS